MVKKHSQVAMFGDGQDLPLFSSTPMTIVTHPFDPKLQPQQATFATCRVCQDAGVVFTDHLVYCSCQVGRDVAAANHKQAGDEPEMVL